MFGDPSTYCTVLSAFESWQVNLLIPNFFFLMNFEFFPHYRLIRADSLLLSESSRNFFPFWIIQTSFSAEGLFKKKVEIRGLRP